MTSVRLITYGDCISLKHSNPIREDERGQISSSLVGQPPTAKPLATRAACKGNHPWPSPLQGRPSRKGQPPTARAATSKRNRPWPWLPPIGLTPTEASLASMMPARSLGGPRPQHCHLRRGDDDDRKSKGSKG
ncbi:hypothetical protein GW17_00053852 [Ensete ventricosum]|nr:hypothetical protein GW17_00053852 [Ensete ventricosum]